jgi:hypothetical protein
MSQILRFLNCLTDYRQFSVFFLRPILAVELNWNKSGDRGKKMFGP